LGTGRSGSSVSLEYLVDDSLKTPSNAHFVETRPCGEQPKKLELMISLKTAKQIGPTIPSNVLVRADKVIKRICHDGRTSRLSLVQTDALARLLIEPGAEIDITDVIQ
jgi:hypothetical protein